MLHHKHHVGFERLVQLCGEIFNLPLSESGAVSIIKRASQVVLEKTKKIGEKVRHGKQNQNRFKGKNKTYKPIYRGEIVEELEKILEIY